MSYKVSVLIEKDEYGYYAFCPELEGCQTQGDSLDDVISHIKEALELYLETLSEEDDMSSPQLDFLSLPLHERQRLMKQQAQQMAEHYLKTNIQRQELQAGDFLEY